MGTKPKVLFIGHYRERGGWSRAAIDYILALDSIGVDVVCRAVKLGLPCDSLPERILELENKSSQDCDVCIQHVLPHHLVAGPFKKNICIYATETNNFSRSGWQNYINLMDEAWVICEDSAIASKTSGVTIPIKVVPHCIRPEKYNEPRHDIELFTRDFLFLTVNEYNQRKNLPATIIAFHSEFDPAEPVNLCIKVNSPLFSPKELHQQITNLCSHIKTDLRLYPSIEDYKKEVIISDMLDSSTLYDLYNKCDCFVNSSYGEAFSYPTLDAIGFGKYPICTNTGGMKDMIMGYQGKIGALVHATESPAIGMKDTFQNLFTGHDTWNSISIPELKREMRSAYNNMRMDGFKTSVAEHSKERIQDYSYENIGLKMESLINE